MVLWSLASATNISLYNSWHPILDTRISPWILKWGGLESSGQRLISSFGKNKRKTIIFSFKKKNSNFQIFGEKKKVIF